MANLWRKKKNRKLARRYDIARLKKGQKLICIPCGRETIISNCGISRTTLWCCGRPMRKRKKK